MACDRQCQDSALNPAQQEVTESYEAGKKLPTTDLGFRDLMTAQGHAQGTRNAAIGKQPRVTQRFIS